MCITSSDTSQLENQLSTCSYNSEETSSFNAGRKNRTALHSSNHIGGASFRRSVKKLCEIPVPTLTLDSGIRQLPSILSWSTRCFICMTERVPSCRQKKIALKDNSHPTFVKRCYIFTSFERHKLTLIKMTHSLA